MSWDHMWKGKNRKRMLRQVRKAAKLAGRAIKKNKSWRKGQRASVLARKRKNGICDICDRRCFVYKDHSHRTGRRRGGLCINCNLALGMFKDDLKTLKRAIKYLKRHS